MASDSSAVVSLSDQAFDMELDDARRNSSIRICSPRDSLLHEDFKPERHWRASIRGALWAGQLQHVDSFKLHAKDGQASTRGARWAGQLQHVDSFMHAKNGQARIRGARWAEQLQHVDSLRLHAKDQNVEEGRLSLSLLSPTWLYKRALLPAPRLWSGGWATSPCCEKSPEVGAKGV